jgi:hypothetical protein
MCVRVYNKDTGTSTDNPREFADMLGLEVKDLPVDNNYKQLIPDSCLCQVCIDQACVMAGFNYEENDDFDVVVSKRTAEEIIQETAKHR